MTYRHARLPVRYSIAAMLSAGLLAGCITPPRPPNVVLVEDTGEPSEQSLEMVRALTQLNNLEEELKQLRNAVEEMQFQQDNADRRQDDVYQDIDRRLGALEADMALVRDVPERPPLTPSEQVLAEGQAGLGSVVVRDAGQGANGDSSNGGDEALDGLSSRGAAGAGGSQSDTVTIEEQQAYDNAFGSLKQSRYEDAIEQFDALVNTWPNSQLADDALYWQSEANYVNREFEVALNGFNRLVDRYPDSSRVPDAMLKVGYIEYDIGAYEDAADTFQEILERFPGHQVTVSAETRLRRIQKTIQ